MYADRTIHEPQPPPDVDSPFNFSMEGFGGKPPSSLLAHFWAPGWNSVQSVNKFQAEVGGPLYGGDPGKRLVEPGAGKSSPYFREVPGPFVSRGDVLLVVQSYHVFGSDELSMLTPGIRERAPEAHLALSEDDMAGLNVDEGDTVLLSVDGLTYRLVVRRSPDLPRGIATVPHGVPGAPIFAFPIYGRVEKVA